MMQSTGQLNYLIAGGMMTDTTDNPFYHSYVFNKFDAKRIKITWWSYPILWFLPTYVQLNNGHKFYFKTWNGKIYLIKVEKMKNMTLEEHDNFREHAKCNWLKCACGQGLVGQGNCIFGGEWNNPECEKFVSDYDYEKDNDIKKCQEEGNPIPIPISISFGKGSLPTGIEEGKSYRLSWLNKNECMITGECVKFVSSANYEKETEK